MKMSDKEKKSVNMNEIKLNFIVFKYKFLTLFKRKKKCLVVIKLDDLEGFSEAVKKMDSFVHKENICVSWGIIGKSLENPSDEYLEFLREKKEDKKHYHFFNHGYLHLWNKEYEFEGTSVEKQLEYLNKTQNIVREKTGIVLDTFGAPCNLISENTFDALNGIEDIKYLYFAIRSFKFNSLHTVKSKIPELDFENKLGNIDFQAFKGFWKKKPLNISPIFLQAHPNMWSDMSWLNFKCAIAYLKFQGAEFIIPGRETVSG
ncbi:MAG: hypothetical protein J5716_06085 [Alphaproteobacteria bacterium]|nr:hypothetical protein [Alphaproteobacteria bacterium]